MIKQDYPDWLAHGLLNAELRWDKAQQVYLPTFLEKYDLHDSRWYGLFTKPNNSTLAIIQWDVVHCIMRYPEQFQKAKWDSYRWPFLLIEFTAPPNQIHLNSNLWDVDYRPIVSFAQSHSLSDVERETLLNASFEQKLLDDKMREAYLDNDLCLTIFEQLRGYINILHNSDVRVLCMDWEGSILQIPGWE